MFLCVNPGRHELTVKRSEFIAFSYMIDGRDEVKAHIKELRERFCDARHVCHAFIADENGDDFGYDDDGEPSGTAGKPIYSALEMSGARRSMIAVVRYFGGIKLGAGGLTRAYRESATGLIESAGLARAERRAEYSVSCPFDGYKRISAIARGANIKTENIIYSDKVRFTLTAPAETDVSSMLAPFGAAVEKSGERFVICEDIK